jgi:hypothetical protein
MRNFVEFNNRGPGQKLDVIHSLRISKWALTYFFSIWAVCCLPHIWRLTGGPTMLTCMQGFVNLVNSRSSSKKKVNSHSTSVTVRCQSNSHCASSISDLIAPDAQTSTDRTACSSLRWTAVLPRRTHRHTLISPLASPPIYSPTPSIVFS